MITYGCFYCPKVFIQLRSGPQNKKKNCNLFEGTHFIVWSGNYNSICKVFYEIQFLARLLVKTLTMDYVCIMLFQVIITNHIAER